MGFLPLLGLLFIGLKLAHIIAWTWWLVLLPIYGPAAFVVALAIITLLGHGTGVGMASLFTRKRTFGR